MARIRYDPKTTVLNLCRQLEIPAIDIPDENVTRVQLAARTAITNTALRIDPDNSGFQHFTPLMRVREENAGSVAEAAIRNPPREITPVLREGVFGVQGAQSPLPREKAEFEGVVLDTFGRITNYVDNDLPKIRSAKRRP